MDTSWLDDVAARIWRARRDGETLDAEATLGAIDEAAASAVQQRLVALRLAGGERVVGWKLGYTSAVMREQMGVDRPNLGPLTDAMLLADGGEVAAHLVQPRVEAEVAVRLGAPLDARVHAVGRDEARAAVAAASACLEVVHSTWTGYRFTLAQNTADLSSAGQVVLGAALPAAALDTLDQVSVVLSDGSDELGRGRGADAYGHPLDALAFLATRLAADDRRLEAGQVVITGGLTRACPLEPGHRLTARFTCADGATADVSVARPG